MSDTRRLFFALPIPAQLHRPLVAWRAEHFTPEAGRPVAAANLHLTLAFLGDVSQQKTDALCQLAARIRQPAFELTLDTLGHWPRPQVVWLGCRRAPHPLLQLAEQLRSHAARNGCYQNGLPFHPHITLLRATEQQVALPASTPGWTFKADHFVLYESTYSGGRTRYQPLQQWPLLS